MADFFELLLKANTKELKEGADEYDNLGDAGERTEKRVDASSNKMGSSIGSMAKGAALALGTVALAYVSVEGAMAATARANTFDAALAETSTLIQGTTAEMAALEAGAISLSNTYGGNAVDQVSAYYQAISAGAAGVAGATTVLEAANKLALGGAAEVSTSVMALSAAVETFSGDSLTAADASDILFTAMKGGVTTISELSSSIGKVTPLAAAMGLEFSDTAAAVSAITKGGLSTAEAVTGFKALLVSINGPSTALAALGPQFSQTALEADGLAVYMERLAAATGGSSVKMQELLGSSEATNAALSLVKGGGETLINLLGDMEDRAGATTDAVDKMSSALSQRLNVSMTQLSNNGLEIGMVLLEYAVPALEAMVAVTGELAANADILIPLIGGVGTALAVALAVPYVPIVTGMIGATVAFGYNLTILTANLGFLAVAELAAASATGVLTAAIALLVSPIGLTVAAIATVAGAYVLLRDSTDYAVLAADAHTGALESLDKALADNASATDGASKSIRTITADYYDAAQSALAMARAEATAVLARKQTADATFNPFDGPSVGELQQVLANLTVVEAEAAALRDRMSEFGLATNEAGEVVDELTGRVVKTSAEMQDMHAKQLAFMAEDRARAAEASAEASEILQKYQDQAEMQLLINQYGADSVQVLDLIHSREIDILNEKLSSLDVSASIKAEIIDAANATYQAEAATSAWSARMAGVAAQINAIASGLNGYMTSAVDTAANRAEIQALEAGASVQEAAHSRTIEQIETETAARMAASDSALDQIGIRLDGAQKIAEVESNAALAAARRAATERDAEAAKVASGSASGGGGSSRASSTSATSEAQRELNRLMDEGKSITEALWTEQEKYNAAIAQADRLLEVGALTTEAYQMHVQGLTEELADVQFGTAIDGVTSLATGMLDAAIAGDSLLDSFVSMLAQMALESAKANIGGIVSGLFGGSPVSGSTDILGGLFSGLFGGARANGGDVEGGTPYLVNENTANSEVFVPSQSGAVLNVPQAQSALSKAMTDNREKTPQANLTNNIENRVLRDSVSNEMAQYFSTPEGEEKILNIIDMRG